MSLEDIRDSSSFTFPLESEDVEEGNEAQAPPCDHVFQMFIVH